jgi:hypothetical protein
MTTPLLMLEKNEGLIIVYNLLKVLIINCSKATRKRKETITY